MSKGTDKVIDRVRKMLALAGNNPSEEEAKTALLKAQEYLAKHGLSMSDVGEEQPDKEVVMKTSNDFKKIQWYEQRLHVLVAKHFRCKSIKTSLRHRAQQKFIGFKEDVELAHELYNFALNALTFNAQIFIDEKRRDGWSGRAELKRLRNDYMYGFINGLNDALTEQKEQKGWGLVLVVDALVIAKNEEITGGEISKTFKATLSGDLEAQLRGYKDGKNFSTPHNLIDCGEGEAASGN